MSTSPSRLFSVENVADGERSLSCLAAFSVIYTHRSSLTSLLSAPFFYLPPSTMSLQAAQRRIGARCLPNFPTRILTPRRTLIPAPNSNSGPLLERRADRELPSLNTERRWLRTLPIFAVVVGAAMLGIFNYQKSSSSVVHSTLYALRTSPRAREILGDEIYFAQQMPWISGEMNQLHGRIDISFWVKGTKSQGKMRFRSLRRDRMSYVRLYHYRDFDILSFFPLGVYCALNMLS